jgi:dTDP-4-dehydrorhamnose reductase
MRILVLGATGMLGSSLVPFLRDLGYEVLSHGRSGAVDVIADLDDRRQAARAVASAPADIVINLVALTDVDGCEERPQDAWRANVRTAQNVAEACSANSSHLIHISTDQVYDGVGPHPEEAALPGNCYAQTKYAGELAALAAGATVLRTNFVGASRQPMRHGLTDWLFESLAQKQPVPVFTDVLFSPLSIPTLCRLIEQFARLHSKGVFNLGAREGMSKAEFAMAFARALGFAEETLIPTSISQETFKARRPKDMRMDCRRSESMLGVLFPSLSEEIVVVAKDYRANI